MPRELLKRSGIAHFWDKDPAAVTRYHLPDPDALAIGKNGKEEPLWERATIEKWFSEQFTGRGRPIKPVRPKRPRESSTQNGFIHLPTHSPIETVYFSPTVEPGEHQKGHRKTCV